MLPRDVSGLDCGGHLGFEPKVKFSHGIQRPDFKQGFQRGQLRREPLKLGVDIRDNVHALAEMP